MPGCTVSLDGQWIVSASDDETLKARVLDQAFKGKFVAVR
jgi:hypothetical protein